MSERSIQLCVAPPVDRRHRLRAGQVHAVLREERARPLVPNEPGRLLGWWVRGVGGEVLILRTEAEVLP